MDSFYDRDELINIGFRSVGEHVWVSRKCSIYGAGNITLGNHVRIDDFCILSGNINIGNHVHIAAYSALYAGSAGIVMDDFSCLSSRCAVYALTDDYKGNALTNPTVPEQYRAVYSSPVRIGKHVVVGTGSTILPGITLAEGSSFGAMTLINKNAEPFTVYFGVPMRKYCNRNKKILEFEMEMASEKE